MYLRCGTLFFVLATFLPLSFQSVLHIDVQLKNEASTQYQLSEEPTVDAMYHGPEDVSRLYGIGLIPEPIEQGLMASGGPRFINGLYANYKFPGADDGDLNAEGIFDSLGSCLGVTIQLAPCIAVAVVSKNPAGLLTCGVGKSQVCGCLKSLPGPLQGVVSTFCGDSAYDIYDTVHPTYENFDPSFGKSASLSRKAYLGTLNSTEKASLDTSFDQGLCLATPSTTCQCCYGVIVDKVDPPKGGKTPKRPKHGDKDTPKNPKGGDDDIFVKQDDKDGTTVCVGYCPQGALY